MRQLNVIEFVTLDGVMQGLGSPDEDRDGGFEHGGWGAPYGDEVLQTAAAEGMRTTTAYLFGRRTYDKMRAFWPEQPDNNPMAAHLNAMPKYVASRHLVDDDLTWANSHVVGGDLRVGVRTLKAEGDGDIAVLGSGALAHAFHLFLHPLLLGGGKRLFNALDHPRRLRLHGVEQTTTGVVILSYETERESRQ
jgi:dihydrofolate reductase